MPIRAQCPGCQAVYTVPETLQGKSVVCKKCQLRFAVAAAPAADQSLDFGDVPPRRRHGSGGLILLLVLMLGCCVCLVIAFTGVGGGAVLNLAP